MKRIVMVIALLLIVATAAYSQAAPKKVLTDADITKIVADYPKFNADMEAIGADFGLGDESEEVPTALSIRSMFDKMRADSRVKDIMKKYGWNDAQFEKLFVVIIGYSALAIEDAMAQVEAGLGEGGDYSADELALMKSQMEPFLVQMRAMLVNFTKAVHPDDLKLIKKNREKLDAILSADDSGG